MTVNTGEVSRLLRLNRHLVKMEGVLNTVATTLMPSLAAKVANPEEPMVDYEMEAQMNYTSA